MDELMDGQKNAWCDWNLHAFARAHELGHRSTGNEDHALSIIRLTERRVELLGKLPHVHGNTQQKAQRELHRTA